MKIIETGSEILRTEETEETTFQIHNSAKAFQILSSNLYKDKIGAIIRELSANAYDAHVSNGNKNVPFEIHIPTVLEPYFSIKDKGPGLSPEDIINVYTKYFASTKTESNDFIGGFGLGSKSPFSYTENFCTISRFDGKTRIYDLYISDTGIPSISLRSEMDIEEGEHTGLEIQIPVINQRDFVGFVAKISENYEFYDVMPVVVNDTGIQFRRASDRKPFMVGDGYKIYEKAHSKKAPNLLNNIRNSSSFGKTLIAQHDYYNEASSPARAIMGTVSYPLDLEAICNTLEGDDYTKMSSILSIPIDMEFKIGELSMLGGREDLSYDKPTIQRLRRRLIRISGEIAEKVKVKVEECGSLLEAKTLVQGLSSHPVYQNAANTIEKFKGFDLKPLHMFRVKVPRDLRMKIMSIRAMNESYNYSRTVKLSTDRFLETVIDEDGFAKDEYTGKRVTHFDLALNTIFYVADAPKAIQRLEHAMNTVEDKSAYSPVQKAITDQLSDRYRHYAHVYMITLEDHNNLEWLVSQTEGLKFVKASEFEAPPVKPKKVVKASYIKFTENPTHSHSPNFGRISDSNIWTSDKDVDEEEIAGIYVNAYNGWIGYTTEEYCDETTAETTSKLINLALEMGILDFAKDKIYAFPATFKIEKTTKVQPLLQVLKQRMVDTYSQTEFDYSKFQRILSYINFNHKNEIEVLNRNISVLTDDLGEDHSLIKFMNEVVESKNEWKKSNFDIQILAMIVPEKKELNGAKTKKLTSGYNSIVDNYPLMWYMVDKFAFQAYGSTRSSTQITLDLIKYIKTIDISNKLTSVQEQN